MRTPGGMRLALVLGVCLVPARGASAGDAPGSASPRVASLVFLAPGTRIGKEVPAGWSDLVIKSTPVLASGDLSTLPAMARGTATLFRTVLLADVRRQGGDSGGYELRRIGLGICMPVDGVDMVVSTASLHRLPVSLGLIERQVLRRVEEEHARGRLGGRTPTFALYSSPVTLKVGTSHVPGLLRYAFQVDPETGVLRTFLWPLGEDPRRRKLPEAILLLPPGLRYRCGVDVRADRLLGAIPASWSFAMGKLPPGQPVSIPASLQALAIRERLARAESEAFEAGLRRIPAPAAEADVAAQ